MSFSENLYRIRKEKKLSQKKLAEIANVSQASINYWEKGQRTPSIDAIEKLSTALDVRIADLMGISVTDLESFSNRYNLPGKNSAVYDFGSEEYQIAIDVNSTLDQLNLDGKREVRKQVNLISKIPEYRKDTKE